MDRTHILTVSLTLALVAIAVPQAHAYMTPEQVLLQQEHMYYFPTAEAKTAREIRAEQEEKRVAKHLQEQEELIAKSREEERVHAAALAGEPTEEEDEEIDDEPQLVPGAQTPGITLDAAALRLLSRIERIREPNLPAETVHSGAPLTPTGPAVVIAIVALVCAGIWTVRRATKLERAYIR
ncbi:MAG: hypothetical protein Q7R81_07770 [Candidatus Peregrinibacteria bacterium]|nr:hypothetical protein [Candidatus Peregrinibacteria bacterium]